MRRVICAVLLPSLLLAAPGWASAPARAASKSVRDEGTLRYARSSGSQVIDEGSVHGTLPGYARVRFTYNGNPTVTATFTFSGYGWSLSGRAGGQLHNPYSATPSFRGRLTITSGSGRYAHARGAGELFGVFDRRTYGLIVQALVTLR